MLGKLHTSCDTLRQRRGQSCGVHRLRLSRVSAINSRSSRPLSAPGRPSYDLQIYRLKPMERILFSDVDGTLVHYPEPDATSNIPHDSDLIKLPTSTSGRQGVTSCKTLQKAAAMRVLGVKIVIITGSRTSTLLQRVDYLPVADAYVCENGGRIFYPTVSHTVENPALVEDLEWRGVHQQAGPGSQDDKVEPLQRQGPLWDVYRKLHQQRWKLDARSYGTAFRLHQEGKSMDALHSIVLELPALGLTASYNLGCLDIYPSTSGKEAAAGYLMQRWTAAPQHCAFMCDDDNDLKLASRVGRALVVSIGSESMAATVSQQPEHFIVARKQGVLATEESLDAAAAFFTSLK